MIPLIPALALAFVSFLCSAFVILRIVIPILPPHPLSRRVAPSEFGLPNFRSLSPADKGHLWLASLDLLALGIFTWQAINEAVGGPQNLAISQDPASAVRLWFALTIRQTCLLIVAGITLLHVRLGRSVSFGSRHWLLWAPTLVLAVTSTALAGVMSGAGLQSLFIGLLAYSSSVAVLSSVTFGCLVGTLIIIKRNLTALNEEADPWPPVKQMEEKPRPSFATEEIDALRDGASWITSNASSRHNSISAWSFSTHHTAAVSSQHGHARHPAAESQLSVAPKSSFWFGPATGDTNIPPVPPLPSPYGPLSPTSQGLSDPDPFRRIPTPLPEQPRERFGSQTSWLTSTNGSHTTLSAWSYPTQHEGTVPNASIPDLNAQLLPSTAVSRPNTPALAKAKVLGGYGYAPGSLEAEKGLESLAAPAGTTLDISIWRTVGWLLMIWIPLGFSVPYLSFLSARVVPPESMSILLILSVTMSSPILALNILLRSPIPIPHGLFDVRGSLPTNVTRGPSPSGSVPTYKFSHEYKRSCSASITVVEGRRSGDVWIAKGDAVDGKSKIGRALEMLAPKPKLSVLPPEEPQDGEVTPPLPMQIEDSLPLTVHNTPHSVSSVELGRIRKDSKNSSRLSVNDESLAFNSKIMVAQRHYSAIAKTVIVDASPEKLESVQTNVILGSTSGAAARASVHSGHLRSRSVASVSGPNTPTGETFNVSPSPPPAFPLPPTPPNVRAARLAKLKHKKSFSSGFSFGPVDDMNEIDALTAGVLPLLVPGLKVGSGMKIKEGDYSPPMSMGKATGSQSSRKMKEFGALPRDPDFSSPEVHSTPARRHPREPRGRKTSTHKKNHFSLPSLSLGKDGVYSLATEITHALESKIGQYIALPSNVDIGRRATVWGGESVVNTISGLHPLHEEDEHRPSGAGLARTMSTRSLGLRADVPHSVDSRSSVASINMIPPSAASTATLFELDPDIDSGPQAESTPHNTVSQRQIVRSRPPPLPLTESTHQSQTKSTRRSSIVYIKSENSESPVNPPAAVNEGTTTTTTTSKSPLAQWTRAVRPLIPKASKFQRKISNASSSSTSGTKKPGSPGGGLRPLSLLRDRDPNVVVDSVNHTQSTGPGYGIATAGIPMTAGTRPLTLGKKQRSRMALTAVDENENIAPEDNVNARSQHLKPLQLARSETSKMRGILRRQEVLPDVVVRPPSDAEDSGFAFAYAQ